MNSISNLPDFRSTRATAPQADYWKRAASVASPNAHSSTQSDREKENEDKDPESNLAMLTVLGIVVIAIGAGSALALVAWSGGLDAYLGPLSKSVSNESRKVAKRDIAPGAMPSKAIIGHWKMLGNVQRERWHHEATGRDETRKGGYTEDDLFEPSRGGSWFVQTKIGKKYIVKVDEVGTVQRWIWDISVENNRVTPKVLEIIAWPEGSDSQSNRPIQRWSFLFDESYEMMGVYVCDAKGKLPWHTDYNDPAPGYSWKDKCNGELLKYVDDKRHE